MVKGQRVESSTSRAAAYGTNVNVVDDELEVVEDVAKEEVHAPRKARRKLPKKDTPKENRPVFFAGIHDRQKSKGDSNT